MYEPTHLDLFSGIGGFALAAQWAGFRTVGFCEIDGYCRKVLQKNFGAVSRCDNSKLFSIGAGVTQRPSEGKESGNFPALHIDIFDLNGTQFRGVSLITGGFPCQPFSVAGKRRGAADDRAIWPQMFRVVSEARPAWVLGENVPGIIPMELDNVLSDLEGIGYATRSFVIPACAVDARHRRDRLWIVGRFMGDPAGEGSFPGAQRGICGSEKSRRSWDEEPERRSEAISNTDESRSQGRHGQELRECADERVTGAGDSSICDSAGTGLSQRSGVSVGTTGGLQPEPERSVGDYCQWESEPAIRRVANGVRNRVDRLKGLGNAIVPQVAFELLREIRKCL